MNNPQKIILSEKNISKAEIKIRSFHKSDESFFPGLANILLAPDDDKADRKKVSIRFFSQFHAKTARYHAAPGS